MKIKIKRPKIIKRTIKFNLKVIYMVIQEVKIFHCLIFNITQ